MPYAPDNRKWLKRTLDSRIPVDWVDGAWEVARHHLWTVVEALADRFGEVEAILDFRTTERCDIRCVEAVGDECVCACAGMDHGGLSDVMKDWMEVGDTTLISTDIKRRHFRVRQSPTLTQVAA